MVSECNELSASVTLCSSRVPATPVEPATRISHHLFELLEGQGDDRGPGGRGGAGGEAAGIELPAGAAVDAAATHPVGPGNAVAPVWDVAMTCRPRVWFDAAMFMAPVANALASEP